MKKVFERQKSWGKFIKPVTCFKYRFQKIVIFFFINSQKFKSSRETDLLNHINFKKQILVQGKKIIQPLLDFLGKNCKIIGHFFMVVLNFATFILKGKN